MKMRNTLTLFGLLLIITLSVEGSRSSQNTDEILPKLLSMPELVVPPEALKSGVGGKVNVYLTVNKKGNVAKIDAVEGPGNVCWNYRRPDVDAIRRAAETAVRQATFAPGTRKGSPVNMGLRLTFTFPEKVDERTDEEKEEAKKRMENSTVLNGREIRLPTPTYSKEARDARISGTVSVNLIIDENGNIFSAVVKTGHPLFHASSLEAACRAKFSVTTIDGVPSRVMGVITYNFVL